MNNNILDNLSNNKEFLNKLTNRQLLTLYQSVAKIDSDNVQNILSNLNKNLNGDNISKDKLFKASKENLGEDVKFTKQDMENILSELFKDIPASSEALEKLILSLIGK